MVRRRSRILCLLLAAVLCAMLLPVAQVEAYSDSLLVRQRQIFAYLTEQMGLNPAAACGVLANIEAESNFTLSALGDGGTSYGLCQWHNDRYTRLMTYCMARGLDYQTLPGQLDYLNFELRTSYPSLLGRLRSVENSAEGAYQAAFLWCVQFERPAGMEKSGARRGEIAQSKYWPRFRSANLPRQSEDASLGTQMLRDYSALYAGTVVEWSLPEVQARSAVLAAEEPAPEQQTTTRAARIRAYVPHHSPAEAVEKSPSLLGASVAVALMFMSMGDGRRRDELLYLPVEQIGG